MPIWAFFLAFVAIVVVAAAGHYLSSEQRARRALRAARSKPVNQLGDGDVGKVHGVVKLLGEPLVAPFSSRPCAYYAVVVEECHGENWETVLREANGSDFLLCDGDEEVRVVMDDARVVGITDHEQRSGTWNNPTRRLEEFLSERGHTSRGVFFNKQMRYREIVLEPGERVAVFGQLGSEIAPNPKGSSYREPVKRRFVSAPKDGKLIVSDDPSLQA